jgi:hypothetical protein
MLRVIRLDLFHHGCWLLSCLTQHTELQHAPMLRSHTVSIILFFDNSVCMLKLHMRAATRKECTILNTVYLRYLYEFSVRANGVVAGV